MPPHNPLFGHLLEVYSVLSNLPSDAHPLYLADQLRRKYPDMGPVFYVDLWPFHSPFLFANSPTAAYQLLQERSPPKADPIRKYFYPLTRNNDIVSMEGPAWKEWRSMFNPAFSASHLITLVPMMLEAVSTYCKVLAEHAESNGMFSLEDVTIGLTLTIIGIVTLYVSRNVCMHSRFSLRLVVRP
jgi:cytochrome P450